MISLHAPMANFGFLYWRDRFLNPLPHTDEHFVHSLHSVVMHLESIWSLRNRKELKWQKNVK
jgi:hypothetical protein